MSALRLDQKGFRMLGYGMVDVNVTANNVWRAVIEPIREGQYTLKLQKLIHRVIHEPEAREVYEEILNYKWLQTENLVKQGKLEAGSSLTLEEAAREWMDEHYPAWKANRKTLMEVTPHDDTISAPDDEDPRR